MRRLLCVLAAFGFVMLATSGPAAASIVVHVDRSSERMEVIVDGAPRYHWRVSTARRGYITPPGIYHPQRLALRWYSKKYDNAPMPHSIFFYGGYAIHGTYEISGLGRAGVAWLRAARSRPTPRSSTTWSSATAWAAPPSWCISALRKALLRFRKSCAK